MTAPLELNDAETSVKELFKRAFMGEPQIATRHGVPSLVIITYADFATTRMPVRSRTTSFRRREDDQKKIVLTRWLDDCGEIHADRIVPFDYEVANLWGKVVANLQRAGKTLPVIDSQIAATAPCYGMTLVSRNVR